MGVVIMAMAVPAGVAVARDLASGRPLWKWAGAAVFVVFAVVELLVDYVLDVEFRRPARPAILAPYLLLFFGSIVLMGIRMYPVSKPLWGITALTAVGLVTAMMWAHTKGVG